MSKVEQSEFEPINKVVVTGLFGIFDHVIPLNVEERITIIHGLNGYGKTFILKFLNALGRGCGPQYFDEISGVPFNSFEVKLGTSRAVKLSQKGGHLLLAWTSDDWSTFQQGVAWPDNGLDDHFSSEFKDLIPPELLFVGDNQPTKHMPEIRFISTERLHRSDFSSRVQAKNATPGKRSGTVAVHSSRLRKLIEQKLAEFGKFSQSLDSSFPARYVKKIGKNGISGNGVKERLEAIERRRERFIKVGVLSQEAHSFPMPAEEFDESTRDVLAIYAEDTEAKLNVLEDTVTRVELLLNIINRRFRFKTMEINGGYCFRNSQGKTIPLAALSTGEQHQLVMLYQMLFEIQPGTLVLIDEPELSLHIAWARHFVEDLQAIARLSKIHILLATHSPDLIHDRWDLTVELKGPE